MQKTPQQIFHLSDSSRTERCFNLFYFVEGDLVVELGAWYHKLAGDDVGKMFRLQQLAAEDLGRARRFPLPNRFVYVDPVLKIRRPRATRYQTFLALAEQGGCEAFEEVLAALSAGPRPMMCITPIVDGVLPELHFIELPKSGSNCGEGATS